MKNLSPGAAFAVRAAGWTVLVAALACVPFAVGPTSFRVDQIAIWMALAIAACGLNLLTGYNGQISVGHGALYGAGAYATAIFMQKSGWPMAPAAIAAVAVCFVLGIVIGLPALRIKGLYLALVTLAVAVLFPLAIEQFSDLTGGGGGLSITTATVNRRGAITESKIEFSSMFGLEGQHVRYLLVLAVMILCFVLTRNLVKSRIGRSLVAIRDNEIAAAVSGVPVSRVKIIVFGISSAMAGLGGAMFAIVNAQVNLTSFTIAVSISLLVAVVVGGPSSIVGPAIGAALLGAFNDFLVLKFGGSGSDATDISAAKPVILGAVLILLMFFAPGGLVGLFKTTMAKRAGRGGATPLVPDAAVPSAFAAESLGT
jgi:branched-chain amino acid transport system permease protein